jgi:hypothetical protein
MSRTTFILAATSWLWVPALILALVGSFGLWGPVVLLLLLFDSNELADEESKQESADQEVNHAR